MTTLPDLLIAHAEARLRRLDEPTGVTVKSCIEWQAAERIKQLEAMLRVAGYSDMQIAAGTPYIELMGG